MKQTILITGAGPNGVTGRRIKDCLADDYNILAPTSKELDLRDSQAVTSYIDAHDINFIIHSAVMYPKADDPVNEEDNNLKMFNNIVANADKVEKIFYFGSGAEYDKSIELHEVTEDQIGKSIPKDNYGRVKYEMNMIARASRNIYNLRLFGTINPYERYTKNIICNLFAKAISKAPHNMNRNCLFSFVDIDDVAEFIKYGMNNDLRYHDYNLTADRVYTLEYIDELIRKMANPSPDTPFKQDGFSKEYTGSSERVSEEFNNWTPISVSLSKVYKEIKKYEGKIDIANIDNRWK